MTNVELKRIKVELLKVHSNRVEMELRIEEAQENVKRVEEQAKENIKRLEDNIVIQKAKEAELQAKIDAEAATSN